MSVGIRQKNNVHEFVTLTGKVNIEARSIFQSVLATPPTAEAAHAGTNPSSPVAVRGDEVCC